LRWDIFCRVIDNHGDLGVCWRLARDLAARGHAVRLAVDDPRALAWMAPEGAPRVQVWHWAGDAAPSDPGDVVVEAFGCDPPPAFVAAMAAMATSSQAPVWINLEYLSAEAYVERSHRLPSPQHTGPGAGLTKWFFYPGFTPATGGLLREPELAAEQATFDAAAWLHARGIAPHPGERLVSVFCYPGAPLAALVDRLRDAPALLLTAPGAASDLVANLPLPAGLRSLPLPWLTQPDYDRLLWACDLNLVRGEDSFVRAQWAGRPFLWHIYPQDDGVHETKLDAFLTRHLAAAPAAIAAPVRQAMRGWNSFGGLPARLPDLALWQTHVHNWRENLLSQPDLTAQLLAVVTEKR
jgi:uncharacterized repeat protein (TIGR03837 family)